MFANRYTTIEFEKRVHDCGKRRKVPYGAIAQALDIRFGPLQGLKFTGADVEEVLSLAVRLSVSLPRDAKDPKGQADTTPRSAGEVVTSDYLCDSLEPQVLEVRRFVFGSDRVPFKGSLAARRWIIRAQKAECANNDPGGSGKNVSDLIQQLARITGCTVSLEHAILAFPTKKKGEVWLGKVSVLPGGDLGRIAETSEKLSKWGFDRAAITWWILCGIRPIVPRLATTTHHGRHRSWVTVEINAKDLGWRELSGLYKRIQQLPNLVFRKVSPLHLRIHERVRAKGGIPREGQVAFWTAIQKELGPSAPKSWRGVKKAYRDLARSQGRQSLPPPS